MNKFKNAVLLLLAAVMIFAISCGNTDPNNEIEDKNPAPWDGTTATEGKTESDVYIITEAAHLVWLASDAAGAEITKNIRFDANIDMNKKSFGGIKKFTGSMDGNGKSIKNLLIEKTTSNAGLILELGDGGSIKDLTIESGSIKATASGSVATAPAGAFVGKATGTITITGVLNKASVESGTGTRAGGIIGSAGGYNNN